MPRDVVKAIEYINQVLEPTSSAIEHRELIITLIRITNEIYNDHNWVVYDYSKQDVYRSMSFSDSEWQWEFTRRNEIYRRLWLANRVGVKFPAERVCNKVFGSLWLSDPNTGVLDIRKKAKSWSPIPGDIFPPDFDSQVKFLRDFRPSKIVYEGERIENLKFTSESQFYFRFDDQLPLGPQILEVKSLFASSIKKLARRVPRTAFPEYLRVWDAASNGLSYAQIAPMLRKERNEQSARDSLRAAKRLIRGCATVF